MLVYFGIYLKTKRPLQMTEKVFDSLDEGSLAMYDIKEDIIFLPEQEEKMGVYYMTGFDDNDHDFEINDQALKKMRKAFWEKYPDEFLKLKEKLSDLKFCFGIVYINDF